MARSAEEMLYPRDGRLPHRHHGGQGARGRPPFRSTSPRSRSSGATTRSGLLPNPLRDRFGFTAHLEFYDEAELEQVLERAAVLLELDIDRRALAEIAGRCRGTPRIANRLLRRVRDYALVHPASGSESDLAAVHAGARTLRCRCPWARSA
ncbi:MAG: hypothetical protein WDM88_08560 [Galbitalea sp.]